MSESSRTPGFLYLPTALMESPMICYAGLFYTGLHPKVELSLWHSPWEPVKKCGFLGHTPETGIQYAWDTAWENAFWSSLVVLLSRQIQKPSMKHTPLFPLSDDSLALCLTNEWEGGESFLTPRSNRIIKPGRELPLAYHQARKMSICSEKWVWDPHWSPTIPV